MTKENELTQEGLDKIDEILKDAEKVASDQETLKDFYDLQEVGKSMKKAGKVARRVLDSKENAALAGDLFGATSTGRSIYIPTEGATPSEYDDEMITALQAQRAKEAIERKIRMERLMRAEINRDEREDISNITKMIKGLKFLIDSLNSKNQRLDKANEEKKSAFAQKMVPLTDELEDINLCYREALSDLFVAIANLRQAKTHFDTSSTRYDKAVTKYNNEVSDRNAANMAELNEKQAILDKVTSRVRLTSTYRTFVADLVDSIERTLTKPELEANVNKEYLKKLKNEVARVDDSLRIDRERIDEVQSDINALNARIARDALIKPLQPETAQPDHICKLGCKVDYWRKTVETRESELEAAQKVANEWLFKKLEKEKDLDVVKEALEDIIKRVETLENEIVDTTNDADKKAAAVRKYIDVNVEPRYKPTNDAIANGMTEIFGELNKLEADDPLARASTTLVAEK